jgi:putative addiction module CopG family antidote
VTRSVSVGSRYEKLADYLIKIGRYENRSEVFRQAMRLLENYEYSLGFILRAERQKVLMSTYSELCHVERELEFPSRRQKHEFSSEKSLETIKAWKDHTELLIDQDATILSPPAPPARFDTVPPTKRDKTGGKR